MFVLLFVPVAILIGYLSGGRLSGLGQLELQWVPLVLLALVLQLLIFPLFSDHAILDAAVGPLHLLSYGLLAVWLARNLRTTPIVLLSVGAACNLAVLLANGGRMPASTSALQRAGFMHVAEQLLENGVFSNLILMSSDTRLNFLGDVLFVPEWIPLSSAFSIGDTLIMLALGWLIVKGMRIDAKRTEKTA